MNNELSLRVSCLSTIAEVIRQMEGAVYGRIRIQKTLYFLKRLGLAELGRVPFFYHHYGPFSWIVAESLADGVQCDAVIEDARSSAEDRQRYKYTLGPAIEAAVDPLSPDSVGVVKRLIDRVRREEWRTLELASTIDYLQQTERLDRATALTRALGLKPACRGLEGPALRLLDDLRLPAA